MAGDPDLATTEAALRALDAAGADVIELGVPYSDPLADGPTIQGAHTRGLDSKTTLSAVLAMVARVSPDLRAALVMFTYYNPILRRGAAAFCAAAAAAGVAAVLVPDIPLEETHAVREDAAAAGLELVLLATPTTPPARMKQIAEGAGGFLYAITRTGVTGAGELEPGRIRGEMETIRQAAHGLPVCLGFGIRTAADVRLLAPMADGLVVGSALVRLVEENAGKPELPALVADFVRELATALSSASAAC